MCFFDKNNCSIESKITLKLTLGILLIFNNLFPLKTNLAIAETILKCQGNSNDLLFKNQAFATYQVDEKDNENIIISNSIEHSFAQQILGEERAIKIIDNGIKDQQGNKVVNLAILVNSLGEFFHEQDRKSDKSIAVLELFLSLPKDSQTKLVSSILRSGLDTTIQTQIKDEDLLLVLIGSDRSSLMSLGLTETEAQIAADAGKDKILNSLDLPLNLAIEEVKGAISQTLGDREKQETILNYQQDLQRELEKFRDPKQTPSTSPGAILKFEFLLRNEGNSSVTLPIPNAATIQATGFTGAGTVTGVQSELISKQLGEEVNPAIDTTSQSSNITIPSRQDLKLTVRVTVGDIKAREVQSLDLSLGIECGNSKGEQSLTIIGSFHPTPIEPVGSVTSCTANTPNTETNFDRVKFFAKGIEDSQGNKIVSLGILADAVNDRFIERGLSLEEANQISITVLQTFLGLDEDIATNAVSPAIKSELVTEFPGKQAQIEQITDAEILTILAAGTKSIYSFLGLSEAEAETAANTAQQVILANASTENPFTETIATATEKAAQSLEKTESQQIVTQARIQLDREINNLRQGQGSIVQSEDELQFQFLLENQAETVAAIEVPTAQSIEESAFSGSGTITEVKYSKLSESQEEIDRGDTTNLSEYVLIPPKESLKLTVKLKVGELPTQTVNSLKMSIGTDCGTNLAQQSLTILPPPESELIDPLGQITGCGGEALPDYQGFSIALYDPDPKDPTGGMSSLISLTPTEVPDDRNNQIPKGLKPNSTNSNPFFLTNEDKGKYNFLFDAAQGQLSSGKTFILVVNPPENSVYSQRRIKIVLGDRNKRVVQYTATSLDGKPITASSSQTTVTGKIVLVKDAERVGLSLAVLDLATNICEAQEISITKTGDRATAAPGDTVLYRIAVKNLAQTDIEGLDVKDTLPPGFKFVDKTVAGEIGGEKIAIATKQDGQAIHFTTQTKLAAGKVLNLVYGAQLTPDALRGSGDNSAIVNGLRADNNFTVKDGPAIHHLKVEAGIIKDTGIIIGRVFVDKNFDGAQQPDEPGVPDAVIFLEDGNRIVTDDKGLFSVANMLSGYHTGILDLTSIPEYVLAPNHYFKEGNSKSRLVHLEPGGMVRMNFGVTPRGDRKEKK